MCVLQVWCATAPGRGEREVGWSGFSGYFRVFDRFLRHGVGGEGVYFYFGGRGVGGSSDVGPFSLAYFWACTFMYSCGERDVCHTERQEANHKERQNAILFFAGNVSSRMALTGAHVSRAGQGDKDVVVRVRPSSRLACH